MVLQCAQCGTTFETWTEVWQHFADIHPGVTPYGCGICKLIFQSTDEVREHFYTTHAGLEVPEEPMFICPVCEETFYYQINLNRHIKDYHPEYTPPLPCIIATVFLGENHPLLQPLRNFRDVCLDANPLISKMYGHLLKIYYKVSVFFLRKMGKLSDAKD